MDSKQLAQYSGKTRGGGEPCTPFPGGWEEGKHKQSETGVVVYVVT